MDIICHILGAKCSILFEETRPLTSFGCKSMAGGREVLTTAGFVLQIK